MPGRCIDTRTFLSATDNQAYGTRNIKRPLYPRTQRPLQCRKSADQGIAENGEGCDKQGFGRRLQDAPWPNQRTRGTTRTTSEGPEW